MYKKMVAFCLLLSAIFDARAQVSMTLQVPPIGVLVKNQLWNMLLVNSGNASMMVRVNLALLDEKTNQPVLTASSMPILLTKGARQLQARDLGPIQYAYGPAAYHVDQDPNGLLPAGTYQACYTIQVPEKVSAPLVENCIQVNVDPLSPPLLNTPADEGQVMTTYPQFTWLPPTPIGLFNDLSYTIVLVEVLSGQGKGDAIQQNIPVYSAGYLKDPFLNYASSFRALDTSKLYAWRIVAMNAGQPAAMSDIWTFKVLPVRPTFPKNHEEPYLALNRGLNASVASIGSMLRLSYNNVAADTLMQYTVSSLEEAGNPIVQRGQVSLRFGSNLLQIPLSEGAGYAQHKVYLLQFINKRNETWSIKFSWSSSSKQTTSY